MQCDQLLGRIKIRPIFTKIGNWFSSTEVAFVASCKIKLLMSYRTLKSMKYVFFGLTDLICSQS